jgi:hypothetical protein
MRLSLNNIDSVYSGSVLYNVCGDKLTVQNYSFKYNNGKIISWEVDCIDKDGYTEKYSYDELYDSFDDLCDEEKSFIKWIRKNPDIIYLYPDKVFQFRDCYIQAFADGFNQKLKYSAEEFLQK